MKRESRSLFLGVGVAITLACGLEVAAQLTFYTPTANNSRVVATSEGVLLSYGIYGELDPAKGEEAYLKCMWTPPATPTTNSLCEAARRSAMAADAQNRLFEALHEFYARGPTAAETTLRARKLYLLQKAAP